MQVIGAGFPRTGTMSIKLALERLGFGPCYHMREVLSERHDADHVRLWSDAARGLPVDWKALFRGYRATVDIPSAAFYRELLEVYPDARVLLSVRDPERWYASVRETIHALSKARTPEMEPFARMVDDVFWNGLLGGRFEDKAHALEVYGRHVEQVKETVSPERLLVFDVKEGWDPLCRFLGVSTPDTPFPHANDTETFTDYLRLRGLVGDAGERPEEGGEEEAARRLHERMVAFEQQLLEEIRGAWREAERRKGEP